MYGYCHTIKPVFNGHCDERRACEQGIYSHNGVLVYNHVKDCNDVTIAMHGQFLL